MTRKRWMSLQLSDEQYEYLASCARIRQCAVGPLISRLVQVIADDQLVLATLDDDSRILRMSSGRKAHKYKNRASTVTRSHHPRDPGALVVDLPTPTCSRAEVADRSSDPSPVGGLAREGAIT